MAEGGTGLAATFGTKIGKVIRLVRLIRLLRIMKALTKTNRSTKNKRINRIHPVSGLQSIGTQQKTLNVENDKESDQNKGKKGLAGIGKGVNERTGDINPSPSTPQIEEKNYQNIKRRLSSEVIGKSYLLQPKIKLLQKSS